MQTLRAEGDRDAFYEGPRLTGLYSPGPSEQGGLRQGRQNEGPSPALSPLTRGVQGGRWGWLRACWAPEPRARGAQRGPRLFPGGALPVEPQNGRGGRAATSEGQERRKSPLGGPTCHWTGDDVTQTLTTHQAKVDPGERKSEEDVDREEEGSGRAAAERGDSRSKGPGHSWGPAWPERSEHANRAQRGPKAGPRGTVGTQCAFVTSDTQGDVSRGGWRNDWGSAHVAGKSDPGGDRRRDRCGDRSDSHRGGALN